MTKISLNARWGISSLNTPIIEDNKGYTIYKES